MRSTPTTFRPSRPGSSTIAQREGKITAALGAAALMEFVLAVSETELDLEPGSRAAAAHRKRIAAAVAQLVDTGS